MKKRKGQVELVIILGIIFLFLIVLFSGIGSNFFASPIPSGVAERQAAVNTMVLGVIKDGVDQTLRVMERHGGYLDDPSITGKTWRDAPNVEFMMAGVAYWQMCENDYSLTKEEIERSFELSVAKHIRENIGGVSGLFGKNVSFDANSVSVDANILGWNRGEVKRIDVSVNLPTRVDGYDMPAQYHPYKQSIDTRFGEIIRFASDYAKENAANRNMEIFTIYGVYFSMVEPDGFGRLPTSGVLTECGQVLHRDPEQINGHLYDLINYVITQLRWWDVMTTDHDIPKIFAIQTLNGEEYRDLDIYMRLSDGFAFDTHDVIMVTNNKPLVTSSVLTPPVCVQEFNRGYDVDYPIIISVKDVETGNFFNFASHVFVESQGLKMSPGSCSSITAPGQGECEDLQCSLNLRVVDDLSNPIEGAFVAFGNCPLGYTDSNGRVSGDSVCSGDFSIYKNDTYEYYLEEDIMNHDVESVYVLHKVPFFTAHFREVKIFIDYKPYFGTDWQTCTACGSCSLYGIDTRVRCETDLMDKEYMYVEFTPSHKPSVTLPITNIDSGSIDPDCMESDACQFCTEHTNNVTMENMGEVRDACQQCSIDCASGVLENRTIKYIMSGQHAVEGTVFNPYTSREAGGMITTYSLDRNEDEVFINMPRSETKTGNNYQVSDSEKSCLTSYLATCGIDPISSSEAVQKTVVMTCSCDNLLGFVNDVGIEPETRESFCRCPEGSSYSSGCCDRTPQGCAFACEECGTGCSGYLPQCVNCCDVTGLVDYINSGPVQLKTNARLICK